jgi:hypothetical protein
MSWLGTLVKIACIYIISLTSLALPVLSNRVPFVCVFHWIVWWFPKDTELFFCLEFSEATDFRVWCENECVRLIGTKGTYHFRLYILIGKSRFWLIRFSKCYSPSKAIESWILMGNGGEDLYFISKLKKGLSNMCNCTC